MHEPRRIVREVRRSEFTTFIVTASHMAADPSYVLGAWEPAEGHTTISYSMTGQEGCWGRIDSRPAPRAVWEMQPGNPRRRAAAAEHQARTWEQARDVISEAFPGLVHDGRTCTEEAMLSWLADNEEAYTR